MLSVTSAAQVLVAGEQPDPPRPRKPRGGLGEVLADFAAGRPFVVSGVLAGLVDPVITKSERVNPVVRGRRVQANERIRVQPMASRGAVAVDHSHLNIRLGGQRVDERKAGRTPSHDQIIGIDKHAPAPVVIRTIVQRLYGRGGPTVTPSPRAPAGLHCWRTQTGSRSAPPGHPDRLGNVSHPGGHS